MPQMHIVKDKTIDKSIGLKRALSAAFMVIFSLVYHSCHAQNYYFRHYNIENGLAQTQVVKIYQDDYNYLWLGTQNGVSRFNGADFVNYTKINGFKGDVVFDILQNNDQILLRTDAGISFLKAGRIQNYSAPNINFLEKNMVKDTDGNILYFNNFQLYKIDHGKSKIISVTSAKNAGVFSLTKGRNGKVYVAVFGNGIFCKSGNTWRKITPFTGAYKNLEVFKILPDNSDTNKFYLLTPIKLYVAVNGVISGFKNVLLDTIKDKLLSLEQDKQGQLWVGGTKGVFYLRDKNPIHFTNANGFSDNAVNDIYRDNQDNLWLGTNGDGFYKFQGFDFVSYDRIKRKHLKLIMSVANDDFNNTWLATNGNGLIKFSKNSFKHVYLPSKDPYTRYIICLSHKNGQPLLIGTYGGLWSLDENKIIQIDNGRDMPKDIHAVAYDRDNGIWAATGSGCYYLKKGSPAVKITDQYVNTIIEIGKDSILTGTDKGLTLIRKKSIDAGFKYDQLLGFNVISLVHYKNLVVGGTAGDGLFVIDASKHILKRYTTLNGLRSNDIYSLLLDRHGDFWAGTARGIARFNIDLKTLAISTRSEVIPNPVLEYAQNAIMEYDDKIWLGTTKGLFVFSDSKQNNPYFGKSQPVINIESIKVIDQSSNKNKEYNNSPINAIPSGLTLGYGHEHMIISFKGIFYPDPDNLLYRHRLKGYENLFSYPSKLASVEYSALPPGSYTFEVIGIASNGITSAPKYLDIEIKPAFFQTVYFFVLVLIIIIALVVLIQYWFTSRKNKQRRLLEKIKLEEQIKIRKRTAEDFHDDIGNKLTRIAILADMLDRKLINQDVEQKQLITNIKENADNLYRGSKDILWSLDPQNDRLLEVLNNIKYFAIDIFNNTKTHLEFEGFTTENESQLPIEFVRNTSMILKELLYNVFKHANAENVILTFSEDQEKIKFTVSDDGKGFDVNSEKKGRGLANIKTRAGRINGIIEIETHECEGTTVSLVVKLKELINA